MNPLTQALVAGLMMRFGFLDRSDIDRAWLAIVAKMGAERAQEHVDAMVNEAIDALPEGAPPDIIGRALATTIKSLIEAWLPLIETRSDSAAEIAENPMLDFLVASWRSRTSEVLNDDNEAAWWEQLVAHYGGEPEAENVIQACMFGALQGTVRTETEDAKHGMAVGHEVVRSLLRLVDSVQTAAGEPS